MRVLFACLWFTATALDGSRADGLHTVEIQKVLDAKPDPDRWRAELIDYAVAARSGTFDARSDHAAALLRLKRTDEAIPILEALEAEQPGSYYVAANLGTAYELAGRPDDALVWIRAAMERNPGSHYGTEWVHVAILEAEIRLRDDPRWLDSHRVLGVDFGNLAEPEMPAAPEGWRTYVDDPNERARQYVADIHRGIAYQLQERIPLVPPPNAIVADLLVDLAAAEALLHNVNDAIALLRRADEYGAARSDLVQARIAHHQALVDAPAQPKDVPPMARPPYGWMAVFAISVCVFGVGGTWLLVQLARRLRRA